MVSEEPRVVGLAFSLIPNRFKADVNSVADSPVAARISAWRKAMVPDHILQPVLQVRILGWPSKVVRGCPCSNGPLSIVDHEVWRAWFHSRVDESSEITKSDNLKIIDRQVPHILFELSGRSVHPLVSHIRNTMELQHGDSAEFRLVDGPLEVVEFPIRSRISR